MMKFQRLLLLPVTLVLAKSHFDNIFMSSNGDEPLIYNLPRRGTIHLFYWTNDHNARFKFELEGFKVWKYGLRGWRANLQNDYRLTLSKWSHIPITMEAQAMEINGDRFSVQELGRADDNKMLIKSQQTIYWQQCDDTSCDLPGPILEAPVCPKAPECPKPQERPKAPECPKPQECPKAPECPKPPECPKAPEYPKPQECPKVQECSTEPTPDCTTASAIHSNDELHREPWSSAFGIATIISIIVCCIMLAIITCMVLYIIRLKKLMAKAREAAKEQPVIYSSTANYPTDLEGDHESENSIYGAVINRAIPE